ncbi:MAG: hypothetical protein SWZ49_27070 [Cyanobacteriota bacterium]|nr:hypothetical protein [Cyanobacteriota bacterium]
MKFEKGDRVSTANGSGIVVEDNIYEGIFSPFFPPKYRIKLDDSGKEKDFSLYEIEMLTKKPSLKEVIETADKIGKQLNDLLLEIENQKDYCFTQEEFKTAIAVETAIKQEYTNFEQPLLFSIALMLLMKKNDNMLNNGY